MESLGEVFELVLKYCENDTDSISSIALDKWIRKLEPYKLEGSSVMLLTDSEFTKNIISTHYSSLLSRGFENVLGFPVKVELLIRSKEQSGEAPAETAPQNDPAQFDKLTFENFVKGKSNELAYAFSMAVAGTTR